MYLIRHKKNVGRTDMMIRIIVGSILFALGVLRVFPGSYVGAAVSILAGTFLIIEGAARY
ncbi:MAG: DUF2892 domain-containing protein [Bacillota bacterium]|nr:DUF2892 domain-containing protein [Bacillota bacterium]MDW7684633.1 DUF2892 domain-containing protein [Bacillota bacterium]